MEQLLNGGAVQEQLARRLTPRQHQILNLITEGYTSREIGQQLEISPQTVQVHRFNLMRRLDVRNVAELIRQALLLHYLPRAYPQSPSPGLQALRQTPPRSRPSLKQDRRHRSADVTASR